jgi:hypothetical protein
MFKHCLDRFIGMGSCNGINEVGVVPTVLEKLSWIDDFAIGDSHGLDQELGANAIIVLFGISEGLVPKTEKEDRGRKYVT